MGGSGGSTEMRVAGYIEDRHNMILTRITDDYQLDQSLFGGMNDAFGNSPYTGYTEHDPGQAFFGYKEDGETLYQISEFPSIYDMFGKFMAGLDIGDLWLQLYETATRSGEFQEAVSAQSDLLQDDIDSKVLPSFQAGMRDINAVQSSAFIIGKAIIQDAKVKSVNKFSSDLKTHAYKLSHQMWTTHLDWNKSVINQYQNLAKLYYTAKLDMEEQYYSFRVKDITWDMLVAEKGAALLGAALGPSRTGGGGGMEPSKGQKALGGAMSGAAIGTEISPGWGTLIGGIIGGIGGYFS